MALGKLWTFHSLLLFLGVKGAGKAIEIWTDEKFHYKIMTQWPQRRHNCNPNGP